ncbi:MAG TPA: ATP-binding cassette domain-containing protein [Bacteroidales bacterium]|nr:ATP-binding cassette domain-containing protein [Bacteroidales bacterium]HQH18926.1 ATP-binding cassette domain-containing protein [Bacteroidales bacterium]HQI45307.1 ATP-binding cassette domain-containing protein [Bacteroidales bacterium]
MSDTEAIINLNKISVFHLNNLVLSNINIKIHEGEFVYLIGKTGSGKSSLLKMLYADLPLREGEAKIAGYDLKTIKHKEIPLLRRKIGIVFQDFQLLIDRSVNENLLFVMKATGWKNMNEMQSRLQDVLSKVGLGTKGFKMPHQLSGGEQQRVVIARALINNPDIILADEPTGNLDPETSEEIIQLLIDISKSGKAVLTATHNYSLFTRFPARTLKCENGDILEIKPSSN